MKPDLLHNHNGVQRFPASQIDEDERTATMFLHGRIGSSPFDEEGNRQLDAYFFAAEMETLKEFGYNIIVKINSPGGEVWSGSSIFDAVRSTKAVTIGTGLVASMASAILQAGSTRKMNDIATIMIHGVSGAKEDLSLENILNAQLSGILSSRSKMSEDQVKEIMESGEDHWFAVTGVPDNRHALKMGLVDEVIATGLELPQNRLEYQKDYRKLVAVYEKVLEPSSSRNPDIMSDQNQFIQVKSKLGLDPAASEASVLKAVENLQADAAGKKVLETTNATLKSQIANLTKERTDALVKSATDKGYPEDKIESLVSFAEHNYEGALDLVNSLGTPSAGGSGVTPKPASSNVPDPKSQGGEDPKGEGELKTFEEYMKTPANEKEFYNLTEEQQNKVLDAAGEKLGQVTS